MPELLIFRRVRAIDPSCDLDGTVDCVVEEGRIVALGPDAARTDQLEASHARVIDGDGRWLVPAFVDMHAHFREPGEEYKEDIASGLAAAAAGGFGHVCAMPNTTPVNDRRSITEAMVARAREVGGPKLHPIGAITRGLRGEELADIGDMREAGAVAISDDGRCVTSSGLMRRALEYAMTLDVPVIQHCEDHELTQGAHMHEGWVSARLGLGGWPSVAEDIIVARDIMLARYTGARYHVAHLSTRGAVDLVEAAKQEGLPVTAEVTPHHLLLTHEALLGYDTACKVNPPLREAADVDAVVRGLATGVIDAIATDHAPHSSLEKDCEFAEAKPGLVGLELVVPSLLGLVKSGKLPLRRFVDALTRAPSRIVGIESPALREGRPADLVLIDPDADVVISRETLRSKSTNTPFLGKTLKGRVVMTVVQGRPAYEHANHESPS